MKRADYVDIEGIEEASQKDIDLYDDVMNFIRIQVSSALRKMDSTSNREELRDGLKRVIEKALADFIKIRIENRDPRNPQQIPEEQWEEIRRVLRDQYPRRDNELYPNGPTWIGDPWPEPLRDYTGFPPFYDTWTTSTTYYTTEASSTSTFWQDDIRSTRKATRKPSRENIHEVFSEVLSGMIRK